MYRRGVVAEVDAERCRVRATWPQFEDAQSCWLDVLQQNAGANADFRVFDVGEVVACLLDERAETGVVLGAVYDTNNKPPTTNPDVRLVKFSDGTTISYDRSAHRVLVALADGAEVVVKGGSQKVALAGSVTDALTALKDAIGNAVPIAQDGGVGLQNTIMAALLDWPPSVESEVLNSD